MTHNRTQFNQKGFTLVEIMISLAISTTLMAGVVQLYAGSQTNNLINDELGLMQENGRLAMALLSDDIRMAGNLGCADANPFLGVNAGGVSASNARQFLIDSARRFGI